MTSPRSSTLESLYAAAYLERYLDCMETLPNNLQRYLSEIRELDILYLDLMRDVDKQLDCYKHSKDAITQTRAMKLIQQTLIKCTEIGDEKLKLVSQVLDQIETASRRLDQDLDNLDPKKHRETELRLTRAGSKERSSRGNVSKISRYKKIRVAGNSESSTNFSKTNSRKTNSPYRVTSKKHTTASTCVASSTLISKKSNNNNVGNNLKRKLEAATPSYKHRRKQYNKNSSSITRSSSTKKISKFQRKSQSCEKQSSPSRSTNSTGSTNSLKNKRSMMPGKSSSTNSSNRTIHQKFDIPARKGEKTYCICGQVSYGQMIGCDNTKCSIEWFHFPCVDLHAKPKGKWFCPDCRRNKTSSEKNK